MLNEPLRPDEVPREKLPYHHGDLRTALMRTALELIAANGVQGFTLKDAARMAGVSIAAPYRHFADKDALLLAVAMEGFGLFDAALAAAYEHGTNPQERIIELGVAYVRFAMEHTAHFRVMFGMAGEKSAQMESGEISDHGTGMETGGGPGFVLLVRGVAELIPEARGEIQRDVVLGCWSMAHGYALLQIDGALAGTVGPLDAPDALAQIRRTLGVMARR